MSKKKGNRDSGLDILADLGLADKNDRAEEIKKNAGKGKQEKKGKGKRGQEESDEEEVKPKHVAKAGKSKGKKRKRGGDADDDDLPVVAALTTATTAADSDEEEEVKPKHVAKAGKSKGKKRKAMTKPWIASGETIANTTEPRKAFRLATLEKEEQRLINEISHHENQLETELNDSKRKELLLALEIASLKLEINGYEIDLENAATDEEKQRLSDLINKARDTLNVQLQQKQSSGQSI
jgi:hypothetical protein